MDSSRRILGQRLLRKAYGGPSSSSQCNEVGRRRRCRETTSVRVRRLARLTQPSRLPSSPSSFLFVVIPDGSGWARRRISTPVAFDPLLRTAYSLRQFSSSFTSVTSNSLNEPSSTGQLAPSSLALTTSRAGKSDAHPPRRHDGGECHRFQNSDSHDSRHGRRRDALQHVLSSVPVGRMTAREHEVALETIRRVNEPPLPGVGRRRNLGGGAHPSRRRSAGGRQHSGPNDVLDRWRRAVDVLRRLEQEHGAQRQRLQPSYGRGHSNNRSRSGFVLPLPELTTHPYNRLLLGVARIPDLSAAEKVQLADDFLNRMLRDSSSPSDPRRDVHGTGSAAAAAAADGVVPRPDRFTYQAYLSACVEAAREHPADSQIALDKALTLLQRLETEEENNARRSQRNDPNDDDSSLVTRSFYDAVIEIHSHRASEVYGAAAAAEDALLQMSERSTARPGLQPTAESFNRVLRAWSATREINGADRANEILKLQLSLGSSAAAPDQVSFGTVMAAYGTRRRPDDAQGVWDRCVQFWGDQRARGGGGGGAADSDANENRADLTGCFEVLIAAWSQSRRPEAVPRIKDLIRTVVHGSQDHFVVHDTPTIHSCLVQAMVAEGSVLAANEYLVKMVSRCRQGSGPIPLPRTFHTVFGGWKDIIAAEPSQALIAARRSTVLLREMLTFRSECPTDVTTFYLVTDVLCHALSASKGLPPENGAEVSNVVRTGLADVLQHSELRRHSFGVMYHRTVQALCRHSTPESSKMAAQVLNQYYEQARKRRDVEWIAKQTAGLYTSVIAALASCRTLETSEQALDLLRSMPWLSCTTGRELALVPTVRTYTSALRAVSWLRNEHSAQVAAEIFEELKRIDADPDHRVKFDGVVFAVLLEASVANAELCRQIVSKLVELLRSGRSGLDDEVERCRKAFFKALVNSGQGERVALEEVTGVFTKSYSN